MADQFGAVKNKVRLWFLDSVGHPVSKGSAGLNEPENLLDLLEDITPAPCAEQMLDCRKDGNSVIQADQQERHMGEKYGAAMTGPARPGR